MHKWEKSQMCYVKVTLCPKRESYRAIWSHIESYRVTSNYTKLYDLSATGNTYAVVEHTFSLVPPNSQ